MNKKVYSLLLSATVFILSVAPVFGFGGTYPEHPQYGGMVELGTTTKKSNTPSDSKYTFSVGGKSFILLDKDAEGNYFVMTDDLYGKYPYDTTYGEKPIIKTRKANGLYTNGTAYEVDDNEWMFDTADDTNIGYWLNNGFLENGNGEGKSLPAEIKNNIIEYTWQVEGMKAIRGWTANMNMDSKYSVTHAADFAASRVTQPYQVTGKLALMSYTEYLKYQNIIGLVHNEDSWRGFMLRTPHAVVNGDYSGGIAKIFYTFGGGMVKNDTAYMCTCVNDTPKTANMFVRPVMWLDKDFFKNVKIDIATAGKYAKEELGRLSLEELLGVYSAEDINMLKALSGPAPQVTETRIFGTAAVGSVLLLDYKFVPYTGGNEKDTEIYWLEKNANGSRIAAKNTKKYVVENAGGTIECIIAPRDESGAYGALTVAGPGMKGIEAEGFTVSDMDITDEKVTVKFASAKENNARLICALHNAENRLVSVNAQSIAVENDKTAEIAILPKNSGDRITVMILGEDNQPVLVIKK